MIPAVVIAALLAQAAARYPGDMPGAPPSSAVAAPLPLTYVCYGDSLFENGQGGAPCSQMGTAIPGSVVKNNAIAGYTSQQIRDCYFGGVIGDSRCAGYAGMCNGATCSRVVIDGGVNTLKSGDAVTGEIEAPALAPLREVVEDALGQGYDVTWFGVTPYGTCSPSICPILVDAHLRATEFNRLKALACAELSAQYPGRLHCVDPYAAFQGNTGELAPAYDGDGIHWTAAGARLATCLILQAMGRECP